MKYYICITPFFPEPDSFVGPYVLDQVRAIERNSDYKVIVIKPFSFLNKASDYEYDGIKVYRCKDFTLPSNILPNKLSDTLTYRSILSKLKSIGIKPQDIAVCHAHVAALGSSAIRLKRDYPHIKTIVQHHGFDVMSETDGRFARFGWHKRLCQRHNIAISNEADLNIGVSKLTLNYVNNVPGAKLHDTYVLYNGVETSLFNPGSEKPKHDVFTIGCIGNFWELKDQITLIKAIELLVNKGVKNLKTIFIGTGYTRQACEDYVREHNLGDYIEFGQTMHHGQLPEFYRSLDLFVLPSYWEAFGCVYTEAYACGVPFIGVNGQGISELIPPEDKPKWLIDKGDYRRLAQLIEAKMLSTDATQQLCSKIDIDSLITDYLQYLNK